MNYFNHQEVAHSALPSRIVSPVYSCIGCAGGVVPTGWQLVVPATFEHLPSQNCSSQFERLAWSPDYEQGKSSRRLSHEQNERIPSETDGQVHSKSYLPLLNDAATSDDKVQLLSPTWDKNIVSTQLIEVNLEHLPASKPFVSLIEHKPTQNCSLSHHESQEDVRKSIKRKEGILYRRKWMELQKYVPYLLEWITRLARYSEDRKKFLKLYKLYDLLQNPYKRLVKL